VRRACASWCRRPVEEQQVGATQLVHKFRAGALGEAVDGAPFAAAARATGSLATKA